MKATSESLICHQERFDGNKCILEIHANTAEDVMKEVGEMGVTMHRRLPSRRLPLCDCVRDCSVIFCNPRTIKEYRC